MGGVQLELDILELEELQLEELTLLLLRVGVMSYLIQKDAITSRFSWVRSKRFT